MVQFFLYEFSDTEETKNMTISILGTKRTPMVQSLGTPQALAKSLS
jgi:hypothetical protein